MKTRYIMIILAAAFLFAAADMEAQVGKRY